MPAGRGSKGHHLVRDEPRRQRRAEGEERRLPRLRRRVLLRRVSSSTTRIRRRSARRSATTTRCPARPTTAGVIIDSRNDGKTAQMFLANARGVQYDAVTQRRDRRGQLARLLLGLGGQDHRDRLDARDPHPVLVAALRRTTPMPTWGILLYRNYPRDRRYQFFTPRLPRDVNCFICNSSKLHGPRRAAAGLAHGGRAVRHRGSQSSAPRRRPRHARSRRRTSTPRSAST